METRCTKMYHERKKTMILQKTLLSQIHIAPANCIFGGEGVVEGEVSSSITAYKCFGAIYRKNQDEANAVM